MKYWVSASHLCRCVCATLLGSGADLLLVTAAVAAQAPNNSVDVRGASNITLMNDRLFARVAGVSRARDGYITRLDYGCSHPGAALGAAGRECIG